MRIRQAPGARGQGPGFCSARFARWVCTAITFVFAVAGMAQTLDADRPADAVAAVEPATILSGGQGTLKVTLKLMETGHANSNITADPNLIPTSFTPKPAVGIVWGRARYPDAQTVNEWYSRDPLSVYLSDSVIVVPFTVQKTAPAGEIGITGVLITQVCDHEQCYPPSHVTVKTSVKIESAKK